jgi:HAD superfamily hydrolase (TIGR01549 family)
MTALVIWDFDGPIFNSRVPRDLAFKKLATEWEPRIGPCTFDVSSAPLYDPRKIVRLAFADLDLKADDLEALEERYREHLRTAEATHDLVSGMRQALESLQRARCKSAILSLRSSASLKGLLQRLHIAQLFDVIHGRDSMAASKPSPASVEAIITQTGASRESTVMLGDSELDRIAATGAGIAYFHAGWSNEPVGYGQSGVERVLRRPSEVCIVVRDGLEPLQSRDSDRTTLLDTVRAGRFSFFAGAGVSVASGIGGWQECYAPILARHVPDFALGKFSLPEIVQLIATSKADAQDLFDQFSQQFNQQREPNAYHYAMMRSGCGTIWTTNYDDMFEQIRVTSVRPPLIKRDVDLKNHFGDKRKLIKVNGDFTAATFDPASMDWGVVLSDEQFDLSEVQRPEIWRYFEDEYRTSSLIFVGVSFGDPTLRRILSIISRKVMRTRQPHFVLAAAPATAGDRLIFRKQLEMLRQRNIHTVVFADHAQIAECVSDLSIASRRPAVAFSGITYRIDRNAPLPSREDMAARMLEGGSLSLLDVDDMCAEMGTTLAKGGLRVISGHGAGVGVPAVAAAFAVDRQSARYFMRSRGATQGSRSAPAIYFGGDDLNLVRRRLVEASLVLIALGGDSAACQESGTFAEVKMAIELCRPVILFPQAGGVIAACYDEITQLILRSNMDPRLRQQCLRLNEKVNGMSAEQVRDFVGGDFAAAVQSIIRTALVSSHGDEFDRSCVAADAWW